MNIYDGTVIDKLWVGHSKFWIIPGMEDTPYVQTWGQVLKKRSLFALIWVVGALLVARLAVASSSSTIGASESIARAMEILCFSPPERVEPPSPTTVSYPSGSFDIKSWQAAAFAAFSISSCVASGFAIRIFASIVSWNRYTCLLMGFIGFYRMVQDSCGSKMQTFAMIPAVGVVGMALFHGNINCIEPLVYQVLANHGNETIYGEMDAIISSSFALVDLLIHVTFYLQLIVLLYGAFSGKFGIS